MKPFDADFLGNELVKMALETRLNRPLDIRPIEDLEVDLALKRLIFVYDVLDTVEGIVALGAVVEVILIPDIEVVDTLDVELAEVPLECDSGDDEER